MKMLFAVNVDSWNPPVSNIAPAVPKSKELHFIGLYHDERDSTIEHLVAQWIVNSVKTRDLVFRPSISSDSVREENDSSITAWSLFLHNNSYAIYTTKNTVDPGISMELSYDHGQFRPDNVTLIKWDLEMIHRLVNFIDKNVEQKLKEKERSGLN